MTPVALPTVTSHPLTCAQQSSITFHLDQLDISKLHLIGSCVLNLFQNYELFWWDFFL